MRVHCYLLFGFIFLIVDSSYAGTSAQSFTYQGRVFNSKRGVPLEDIVDFTYTIYNPTKNCILYEESQAGVDLTTTAGAFSNQVGSDVGGLKRTANDPGLSMPLIFQNTKVVRLPGTPNCALGYTPVSGDTKYLRVTVTPRSTGIANVLSPDQVINSVPQASTADNVQGLSPTDLIQAAAGVSGQGNVSLANLITLTGGTDASTLHNHDSIYVRSGSGGTPANLGSSAYTSGSLGIGTSSPTGNLGFSGSAGSQTIEVNRNGVSNSVGSDLNIIAGGATLGATNQGGGNLVLSGGMSTGSSGSQILFQTSSIGGAGTADNAGSTKMVLNSSGKLGIGTAAPVAQLEVDTSSA